MIIGRVEPRAYYISSKIAKQNQQKKAAMNLARAKIITPKGKGYNLFEPVDKQKVKHMDVAINLLRLRYSNHPEWFMSEKICFVDIILFTMWTIKYEEFVAFPANPDGYGKLLPAGALDYQKGLEPAYCRSNKLWGMEVDDMYNPLHIKGNQWVALWISLSKRHIVVWDSILSYAKDEEIDVAVEPIAVIMPALIHDTCLAEERHKYSYDRYTHERIKGGVP
ncbi:unnamed protein product [Arabis nemorensis]|uniref:Ubiquitin-like protease family profile domain-containing protein n=1 Tax=Arabis nemorensis TaxID=586526 RepID=A0A565CQW6_9BRAS|nr:unnamed protein product [Arabis nemorensis]